MTTRPRILLQATVPFAADDWHIGRFGLLADELAHHGKVTARNREPPAGGDDPLLSSLDRAAFDEVWLLGVDGGSGLTAAECAGVNRFLAQGGGLLTARDHGDMAKWLRRIAGVGEANFFHDPAYNEPEKERCEPDNRECDVPWPNYTSGRNGDYQRIDAVEPLHPLVRTESGAALALFPAHPHEGAVRAPAGEPHARAVARARSLATGRSFDLIVAFEGAAGVPGRAIAESSFHHFADYNWDTSLGAPSFVSDPLGDGIRKNPEGLDQVRTYVRNAVRWLAPH